MDITVITTRIKDLLKQKGWSVGEFSKQCGISASLLYRYINGEYTNPSVTQLEKMASGFKVPISYLLGEQVSFDTDAGFVSVFKWSLDRNGNRVQTSERRLFSASILSRFRVSQDMLDVIEMPDNSMRPLLNKGDDLLCYAMPETDALSQLENNGVYLFVFDGTIYISRLKKEFDGSLSAWQENTPNQIKQVPANKINLKYQILMRSGVIE